MFSVTAIRSSTASRPHRLLPRFATMGPRAFSSYIVSPPDLDAAIKSPPSGNRIVPVCADWYLPNASQKGPEEYTKLRIPNARFFDVDLVKDLDSPYPHMLPTGETFAKALSEQGINRDDTVVIYDSVHNGIFSGPRAAWTFKVFGHEKVHLLDNFKLWVEQGYPTESGAIKPGAWESTDYPVVVPDKSIVVDFEEVVEHAEHAGGGGVEILDARPKGRFLGVDPEPREGLSSGHVPGAISVPFGELLDPKTKAFKSATELRRIFVEKGIDTSPKTDKVLMCGTGVTAVIIDTALELAGVEGKRKVYDGSWTEWAQRASEEPGLIAKETT